MTSVTADDGSSADKNTDELVWFFAIDMDWVTKRPYSPSLELVTQPAKKIKIGKKKEVKMMAPTLSVIFRTRYNMHYMVEGLRLPDGVDRKTLQCYWRSSDQHAVIWAPCTKETTANDVTGVALSCNGYLMESKEMDLMEQILNCNLHRLEHSSERQRLEIRLANIPPMDSSHQNIVTFHNYNIGTKPVAFVSQILDSKAAEKMRSDELKASLKLEKKMKKEKQFDGGVGFEKEYWFRNPAINFKHMEDKEEKEDEENGEDDDKENVEEEKEGDDEEGDDEEEEDSDEDEEEETDDDEEGKEDDGDEVDDEDEDGDEENE